MAFFLALLLSYLTNCTTLLFRTLGEEGSLGVLVVYLFHSLASRITKFPSENLRDLQDLFASSSLILNEWEYEFAARIFDQYSCKIWFPCLVKVLQEIGAHSEQEGLLHELYLAMQFILYKLQDAELVFELESGQNVDYLQVHYSCLSDHQSSCFLLENCVAELLDLEAS